MRETKKTKEAASEAEGSIVPRLEEEEKRLEEMLGAARAHAADRIKSAENEARLELDKLIEEIPGLVEQERKRRILSIEEESAAYTSRLLDEVRGAESTIRSRKPAAVEALLSALFGREAEV